MPKIVVDSSEFYSVDEAADQLGKGVATVWRYIKANKIIALKIGGRTLVPVSEVERINNQATPLERVA